eukprot:9895671-Lingulodinium_polyedra.AAC.1
MPPGPHRIAAGVGPSPQRKPATNSARAHSQIPSFHVVAVASQIAVFVATMRPRVLHCLCDA